MKRLRRLLAAWGMCLVGVLAVGPVTAQTGAKTRQGVAEMKLDDTRVEWIPRVENDGYLLKIVSPAGEVTTEFFEPGRRPFFLTVDGTGAPRSDGQYRWELVVRRIEQGSQTGQPIKMLSDSGSGSLAPIIESGAFLVKDGTIVRQDAKEPGPPRNYDILQADDVIVQGSLCVGLDCVNGEGFGFDTVRLKEDNTRIKFEDSSTLAGFPSNDWEITVNDSASGGLNKFSITDVTGSKVPFTILAGAPTNSLYIDSSGRVGLRTSTPVLDLHSATSNTPAFRLEQNNSGGFTAQTWDIAANEANFFVRDVTSGSRLPFRIRPGAPTSSIDIGATGNVGIGTASPKGKLDVAGPVYSSAWGPLNGSGVALLYDTGGPWGMLLAYDSATDHALDFAFRARTIDFRTGYYGNNIAMHVTDPGNVGIGTTTPTARLQVAGNIKAQGYLTGEPEAPVPDYVFEPGYKLMQVEDLAKFVAEEKRLPNVPPASEIKQNGLNLADFQMKLLEKIEELTLYTVQQAKTNRDQAAALERKDAEIKALKSENATLDARLAAVERVLGGLSRQEQR